MRTMIPCACSGGRAWHERCPAATQTKFHSMGIPVPLGKSLRTLGLAIWPESRQTQPKPDMGNKAVWRHTCQEVRGRIFHVAGVVAFALLRCGYPRPLQAGLRIGRFGASRRLPLRRTPLAAQEAPYRKHSSPLRNLGAVASLLFLFPSFPVRKCRSLVLAS